MKHEHAERAAQLADQYGRMVFATACRVIYGDLSARDVLPDDLPLSDHAPEPTQR